MPTVRKKFKRSRSKQFAELRALVTRTGKPVTRTEVLDGRRVRFRVVPPGGGNQGRAKVIETDLGPAASKKKATKRKKK